MTVIHSKATDLENPNLSHPSYQLLYLNSNNLSLTCKVFAAKVFSP